MPITTNPFYDPQSTYGWTGAQPFWQPRRDNIGWSFGETQPEASWTRALAEYGLGGTSAKSQWARGQFGRAQEGYSASLLTNPDNPWQEYIRQLGLDELWQSMSPTARGEQPGAFAPNARIIRRAGG